MRAKQMSWIVAAGLALSPLAAGATQVKDSAPADAAVSGHVIRLAELDIDPAQLDAYKVQLRQAIAAALTSEPGVLRLFAVQVHEHPEQIRLFEEYASPAAYQSHLRTAHFLRYKTATAGMVRHLTLLDADPVILGSR